MEIREEKETTTLKRIVTAIKCDICGKLLDQTEKRKKLNTLLGNDNVFYNVQSMHHDWGNDSCDSFDSFDYCPECLPIAFNKYYEETNKGRSTLEFNISRENGLLFD